MMEALRLEGMIVHSRFPFPRCCFDLAICRLDEAARSYIRVRRWRGESVIFSEYAWVVLVVVVVVVDGVLH